MPPRHWHIEGFRGIGIGGGDNGGPLEERVQQQQQESSTAKRAKWRRRTHTRKHREGDMSAAAARCLRYIPTARSMVVLSRNSTPSAKATVALLLPRPASLVLRRIDGVAMDAMALSAPGDGSLAAVMPTMEAVNRNARRPKKVRTFLLILLCSVYLYHSWTAGGVR